MMAALESAGLRVLSGAGLRQFFVKVSQVRMRLFAIGFRRLNHAVKIRARNRTRLTVAKQPRFATHHVRTDRIFCPVVIQRDITV